MRGPPFVLILLLLQASAAFLTDFSGAVSNIERGVGKLIGNVVTDVKDTVYCTISAVERVLILNGLLDKRTVYNRCKNYGKLKLSDFRDTHSRSFNLKLKGLSDNRRRYNSKRIKYDFGDSIKNVNKKGSNTLYNNLNLKSIPNKFKEENKISPSLKQELDDILSNVNNEVGKIYVDNKQSGVDFIWDTIKILNNKQNNSKNPAEIEEIRGVIDKIMNHMNLQTNSRDIFDESELEELKNTFKLSPVYKATHKNTQNPIPLAAPQKVDTFKFNENNNISNAFASDNDVRNKQDSGTHKDSTNIEKSVFDMDPFNYVTPLSNSESTNKDVLENAKKIIDDSQHTNRVLDNFFKEQRKGADVFNYPDIFSSG